MEDECFDQVGTDRYERTTIDGVSTKVARKVGQREGCAGDRAVRSVFSSSHPPTKLTPIHPITDNAVSLQTSRTQPLSKRPCWMRERPKTRTEDGILGKVWSSQRPRGRVSMVVWCREARSLSNENFTPQRSWLPSNVRWSRTVSLQRSVTSLDCIIFSRCIVPYHYPGYLCSPR